MSTKNRTRRTTTRNIRFPNHTLNTGQPHVNEEQNPQNNNPQHPLS
ncbi:hypothetical protein [Escherichia coli]|nr:hypothetical protein [Escherichia coli]